MKPEEINELIDYIIKETRWAKNPGFVIQCLDRINIVCNSIKKNDKEIFLKIKTNYD